MYLFFKRANRLSVALAVVVTMAALVGVAGPRVASADGAASEALLHKVYLGWIGGGIITPGPGEEAGGPLSFDDQNVAHLTVINEVKQTSVSATATQPGATIQVDREDEQPGRFREGYPVTVDFGLRVGRNTVTITVTSADGAAETAYVINITRKQPNGRLGIDRHDSTRSFRIPTPGVSGPVTEYYNTQWLPAGLSGDPTNPDRFWVASRRGRPWSTARITANAYSVSQAGFEQDAGFELPFTMVSTGSIWSDGQTMMVAGWWVGSYTSAGGSGSHKQVYAYQRSETGWARTSSEDVSASGVATSITGLSSDGETLWLTDWGQKLGGKVVAIDRQTKRRVDSLSLDKRTLLDAGITDPRGNWSDGETIWIAARDDLRLYAFDLRTKERISSLDIEVERTQYSRPTGIWSDGETMYVLQSGTRPWDWWVYAYDMHDAPVIETPPIVEQPAGICDRTPQVRDFILANLRDVSDCAAVTDAHLASITGLMYLQNHGITSLKPGDFDGLANVERLSLDGNDIGMLPDGIFDELVILRELYLGGNGIGTLPDGIFDELASLQGLSLYSNDINTLPDGIFDELASLEHLHLHYNNLIELPDGIFDELASLQGLSLYSNDINTLPDGIFDELAMLRELYLSDNDISTLPDGIFDELANLEGLYLDSNALTELPDGIFHNLDNLFELSLMNNQLTTLPAPLFSSMDWRNNRCFDGFCLYIDGNQIAELPDGLFHIEDFDAVRIHMHDNPGAPFTFSMEAEVIDQTTDGDGLATARVRWKVAQGAPLTMRAGLSVTGGTASDSSVAIRSGGIYSNEITVAQSDVGQTATLTLGEVSAHRLRGWGVLMAPQAPPEDSSDWTKYRFHYGFEFAAGAPLTLFDSPTPTPIPGICDRTQQVRDAIMAKLNEGLDTPEVTDCSEVTAEDLSGITGAMELSIEEIPALKSGDFEGLSNLNSLQMIDSGLETLPEDIFDGLTALHSLFIIGNDDLEALPENIFDGLTGLTNLHVSGNAALGELPEGIFDGLTSLGFLHLAENSLTTLPEDIFDGLSGLRLLHLQNNQLTGLPSGIFDGLGSLRFILLNGNSLQALPADVFEGLSSLTQLPLEGNRLESLPDGVFEGLVSLEQVLLSGNPGVPFALTAELEQAGRRRVRGQGGLRGRRSI